MFIAMLATILLAATDDVPTTSLFDGKSLDGWVAEGVVDYDRDGAKVPVWTVEDGLLVCRGKGFGFLRYKEREFGDFTFRVDFRMAPGCNSGVGVRTRAFDPKDSRGTRPSYYSYEIQLIDDAGKAPNDHGTGSLYRYVAPKENAIKPAGEWNTLEVDCHGPRLKLTLNGRLIQDVDQSEVDAIRTKPLRGYICLQNHGGTIAFRNIEVREAGPAPKAE